jgi:hypothetical protein
LFGLTLIVQTSTLKFVQLSILLFLLRPIRLNRLCRLSAMRLSSLAPRWLDDSPQSAPVLEKVRRCRSHTGPQLWLRL